MQDLLDTYNELIGQLPEDIQGPAQIGIPIVAGLIVLLILILLMRAIFGGGKEKPKKDMSSLEAMPAKASKASAKPEPRKTARPVAPAKAPKPEPQKAPPPKAVKAAPAPEAAKIVKPAPTPEPAKAAKPAPTPQPAPQPEKAVKPAPQPAAPAPAPSTFSTGDATLDGMLDAIKGTAEASDLAALSDRLLRRVRPVGGSALDAAAEYEMRDIFRAGVEQIFAIKGADTAEALAGFALAPAQTLDAMTGGSPAAALAAGRLSIPLDPNRAMRAFEAVLGQDATSGEALHRIGWLKSRAGDLDGASEAAARLRGHAEPSYQSRAILDLAIIDARKNDLDAAEQLAREGLEIAKQHNLQDRQSQALSNLGLIAQIRGQVDAAEAFLEQALAIDETLGRRDGLAKNLKNLAALAQARGDAGTAEALQARLSDLEAALKA